MQQGKTHNLHLQSSLPIHPGGNRPSFPSNRWDLLLCKTELMLNLLCQARLTLASPCGKQLMDHSTLMPHPWGHPAAASSSTPNRENNDHWTSDVKMVSSLALHSTITVASLSYPVIHRPLASPTQSISGIQHFSYDHTQRLHLPQPPRINQSHQTCSRSGHQCPTGSNHSTP
jgi:hypothetical protein